MAIITDIHTDRSIFPEQYVRVESIHLLNKTDMYVNVGVYFNEQVKHLPPHRIENVSGAYDLYSSKNVWEQAYEHVKARWPVILDC